jgi:cell division protein FtsB
MSSSDSPHPPQPDEVAPPVRRRRQTLRDAWTRLSLSNLQIILVVLIVIGGRLVIDFGQRIVDGQNKIAQQDRLDSHIQALESQRQQLEADKNYYSSPSYIETWAHSDGKMVRPGEKIVIPLFKGQPQPKPSPVPAEAPQLLPKWLTWWTLFFDAPPPGSPAVGAPQAP